MGLLEADVHTNSPADALFKLLAEEVHNVPDASSDNVHSVQLHEGDWATTGSVKLWTYTIDGRKEVFKEKVEIDKENRVMMLVAVGGDIMEQYRTYRIVYHVFPDGDSEPPRTGQLPAVPRQCTQGHRCAPCWKTGVIMGPEFGSLLLYAFVP
ncbi:hypothetical protein MLD38_005438 [Melastoma candidum]|uniref:Uncharacterized protein n=1 Tax=Melastoma candidum TaxID=119954 RepID=A0ACB9RMP8_9MYRT|nr:hypothetical protein MLD38_005438 [Melastoma candidum]